jgi:hypothetical protein
MGFIIEGYSRGATAALGRGATATPFGAARFGNGAVAFAHGLAHVVVLQG